MQQIITSLAGKPGLTRDEVMAEIESVFAAQLSLWYRLPVMAFFRDDLQLESVVYNNSGGVFMQRLVDLSEIKGRTKNDDGRTVFLDEELKAIFREQFLNRNLGCQHVFSNDGQRIKDFRKAWNKALRWSSKNGQSVKPLF